MSLTVTVPTIELAEALAGLDADLLVWDLNNPAPRAHIDIVVPPYLKRPEILQTLADLEVGLVQSQSIGYDGVLDHLPAGIRFANATGVHEASTAELAIGLMIASLRGLPAHVQAQSQGAWRGGRSGALVDSRVVVVGIGGVGSAVIERLRPFEVEIVRVARTARTDELGEVHAIGDLAEVVTDADSVVLTVPLDESTHGLVDARILAAMKQGALLVNVARGQVVVTDDLVDAVVSGRIRAALDVVDPEPLPSSHPLWTADGVLLTPHVGGNTTAMVPRVARLVRTQVDLMLQGEPPVNLVLPPAK